MNAIDFVFIGIMFILLIGGVNGVAKKIDEQNKLIIEMIKHEKQIP